ncbi:MAG: glycine zipper 2TM domain-containing protein [Pseudomonadota bacterium]
MQTSPSPKHSIHPLLLVAAIAVILFCGIGIAALMGWLPSSTGGGTPASALTASDQLLSAPPSQLVASSARTPAQAAAVTQQFAPSAQSYAPTAENYVEPARNQAQPHETAHRADTRPAICKQCGVVEAIHENSTRAQGSGVGAVGGALLGGLLGNQVGGGHGRQLATVAGAVGGAVVGNQVEGNMRASHSYSIVVHMNDGSRRTLHQNSQPGWRAGDRVRIVNGALRSD